MRAALPLLLGLHALAAALEFDSEARAISALLSQGLLSGGADPCGPALSASMASEALRKGWFLLAEKMVVACTGVGNDKLSGVVAEAAGSIKSSLQHILQLSAATNKVLPPMEPAFQWAQSASSIFVQVKFAHKLDAPACIDLVDPQHFIQESRLGVSSGCKNSDKRFLLDIELFDSINTSVSTWTMTSVGRGTFTLAKNQPYTKWSRLLRTTNRPKNMHFWFDLQEQYDDEVNRLPKAAEKDGKSAKEEPTQGEPAAVVPSALKDPDSIDAKVERDKAKFRQLAEAKRIALEQRISKQKVLLQSKTDKAIAELDQKGSAFSATINAALRKDLEVLDGIKKLHESDPAAAGEYASPAATALEALDSMADDFLGISASSSTTTATGAAAARQEEL